MTEREFLKGFTKDEIIDVIFANDRLDRLVRRDLYMELYEKKSNKILDEMDQLNARWEPQGFQEYIRYTEAFKKLDKELETLGKNFNELFERMGR